MNSVFKELLGALLVGDKTTANKQASIFPPYYGTKLLDQNDTLTDFGLRDSLDYPFPRKLGKLLIECFHGRVQTNQVIVDFPDYNRVFRLVKSGANTLTGSRITKAIEAMPVKKQCEALKISYETIVTKKTTQKVEITIAKYYQNKGYQSVNSEGGDFFVLLRCASWCHLGKTTSAIESTPYIEAMLVDANDPSKRDTKAVEALPSGIKSSSVTSTVKTFRDVYTKTSLAETFPGLTASYIADLYEVVGTELLFEIARLFAVDPYRFRKGWPDITVLNLSGSSLPKNANELFLREIKVKDKLLTSQIITLRHIVKLIPDIGVTKVEYS